MIFCMYHILYAMSIHCKHRSGQSKKKNVRTLLREKIHILIILIVDYLLIPSISMFIGQGLTLEPHHVLRQRVGQLIPLRHPHLRQLRRRLHLQQLWRRPSGRRQHLCHYLLSPHLLKWITLPLHQSHIRRWSAPC